MKRNCLAVVVTLSLLLGLGAQSDERKEIENQLNELYKGKIVTLRHFYRGERLRFDTQGNLLKGGEPGPWTLYGRIEINDVKVHRDRLELRGRRMLVRYNGDAREFEHLRTRDKVRIEIGNHPTQWTSSIARDLSQSVLLGPTEPVATILPTFWQTFLDKPDSVCTENESPFADASNAEKRIWLSMNDSQKRIVSQGPPTYPPRAKQAGLEGTVRMCVLIGTDGKVEEAILVKPAGLGFDETAMETVSNWRYEPLTLDGAPRQVITPINVIFIFRLR
jgi:TonB family protein